jgi:hypothetical protein
MERVFFLPNHNLQWLKNILEVSEIRKGRILIMGSFLYAAYLPKDFRVTVIDKNLLSLISQLYVLWLKLEDYSPQKIKEILFLNKFGNRFRNHKRVKIISRDEYFKSLITFLDFSKRLKIFLKHKSLEKIFREIFRINKTGKEFKLHLIPKGLNSYDLIRVKPTKGIEEIHFLNIPLESFKSNRKFDFIISTNVIENFAHSFDFLRITCSLLTKRGKVEITTYKEPLMRWLKYVKLLINYEKQKTFSLGGAYLFKGKSKEEGREFLYELKMNRDTFIFSKDELIKIIKLISEMEFLPAWLREYESKN